MSSDWLQTENRWWCEIDKKCLIDQINDFENFVKKNDAFDAEINQMISIFQQTCDENHEL